MPATSTLLVLGASGDLSARLLLPGLGELLAHRPDLDLQLVGAGTEDWDDERWREVVRTSFASLGAEGPAVDRVLAGTTYQAADVTSPADLERLFAACYAAPAVYFALPPAVTERACEAMTGMTLPEGTSLSLEKPFGTDLASAQALNRLLATLVPEERTHRVDHFLGRSTVRNLLGLRFANRLLEPVWNAQHIASVEIVYDEQLALEGRARYYDGAGALADMIQSHLLQVMAVFAMEAPATTEARDIRDQKALVLRATRPWGGDPVASSRRARYSAGDVEGRELPAYADEAGVDPARGTETLAEMTVEIANWRWAGVPFRLRSGKALKDHRREIVVTFQPAPHVPTGLRGADEPDRIRILIAPDELHLELNVNGPADPDVIDRAELVTAFDPGDLPPYGQVIDGIISEDEALSVRGDTAEECWRIVEPVIAAWRAGEVPLEEYPAGSAGPWDGPQVAPKG